MSQKRLLLNQMKLEFDSFSVNESFARAVTAAFAAQLDPTIEELADVRTAVSEAVTNCIVHGYRETVGKIALWAGVYDDHSLRIWVKDRGCGIEDIPQARQPLFTTGGEERAGLGFAVMESFMDKLQVRSVVGRGTTVTLEKKITGRPSK